MGDKCPMCGNKHKSKLSAVFCLDHLENLHNLYKEGRSEGKFESQGSSKVEERYKQMRKYYNSLENVNF